MREDLYPECNPVQSGRLVVDERHAIYWEECGNPEGVPVLFVHGGPGAGAGTTVRRFFDPDFYRIIIFDQRGAGRSTPRGEMKNNTTPLLIEDMEKLRHLLGIEKWFVFGGSWGATLSLAYAQHVPERCLGLILRGIFLVRPQEINWFFYGVRTIMPHAWERFASFIPPEERDDLLKAYERRCFDPDPKVHLEACRVYARYEAEISTLLPNPEFVEAFMKEEVSLGLARAEIHYFKNGIFLRENQLLAEAHKFKSIPGVIVQGQYDICCPAITAYDLHQVWPEAELIMVPDGGHSAFEPGIRAELVKAMETFKEKIRQGRLKVT